MKKKLKLSFKDKLRVKFYFFKQKIKQYKFKPMFFDFLKWYCIDFNRRRKGLIKKKLFGVFCFVGRVGSGKTLSIVKFIEDARKKYDNVRIYTNFGYVNENGSITNWKDIEKIFNRSTEETNTIIAIDELQVWANSRDWRNFPFEIFDALTHNRKKSICFLTSTQCFDTVDTNFRRLTNYVVVCKNWAGRYFRNYFFDKEIYELPREHKDRFRDWKIKYIASDELYQMYDTLKIIKNFSKDVKQDLIEGKYNDIKIRDSINNVNNVVNIEAAKR